MITIKKNNPGNIRTVSGTVWQGQQPVTVPPDFVQFDTLANGYRAHIKLLNNYIKGGNNTLEKIIYRWAPPSDNNPTEGYIQFVADKTGIDPKMPIKENDYTTLGRVALAQTYMEHGVKSDDGTLQKAIEQAKSVLSGVVATVVDTVKKNPIETAIAVTLGAYLLINLLRK